jgi:hypothetical protein
MHIFWLPVWTTTILLLLALNVHGLELKRRVIFHKKLDTMTTTLQGTFHRRQLPPPSISFSSTEGREIFKKALQQGYLNAYFRLSETFTTQAHPSFCSLGSLSMALNALLVDPGRVWQGVWRWFDESMLDCCQPLDVTRLKGLTLATLACLAHCNAAHVTLHYGPSVSEEEFRRDIKTVTGVGPEDSTGVSPEFTVMIVSYTRKGLRQSGSGHFSPIGGYEEESDRVLIMDVARFKYPPHWVPLKDLYQSMQDIDPESGKPRGYILLQATNEMFSRCDCSSTIGTECAERVDAAQASHDKIEDKIEALLDPDTTTNILESNDSFHGDELSH